MNWGMNCESLEELKSHPGEDAKQVGLREESDDNIRVVVGMATCGIAAGARPVLEAFCRRSTSGPQERHRKSDGLHRRVRLEPIAEVYVPGQER